MSGILHITHGILRIQLRVALFIAALCLPANYLLAASCSIVQHPPPSEAEKAYLAADYAKAALIFKADLAGHPGDPEFANGLVHALLQQQKVQEAADALKATLAVAPKSAALITLRGEIELRQGLPWIAAQSAYEALKLDPCNPRSHFLLSELEWINSLYASSRKELETAHKLDSEDPEIRGEWIHTLSLKQKITETEAYLSAPRGDDQEETHRWQLYLEMLKKKAAEPGKACHLVSPATTAEIPFIKLMNDATHMEAFGLEVKLNNRSARLEIDTGANGLLVTRTVAHRAGLKPYLKAEIGGVGDEGAKSGYTAYADSIRIGNLEFQDCMVQVVDSRNMVGDVDGLIGMDVFSHFLVSLDYPMHKLLLGPLPPRPGETAPALALRTSQADPDDPDATDEAVAPHGLYDRYIAPEMKSYTPVYRIGHNLILPTALNDGKQRLFILDTGAFSTIISPQVAREVSKMHADARLHVEGLSGKVDKAYLADEVTFKFAHLSHEVVGVVSIDISSTSKELGMEISGFLGADTLYQLTIHIDYRDGLVGFDYDANRGYQF